MCLIRFQSTFVIFIFLRFCCCFCLLVSVVRCIRSYHRMNEQMQWRIKEEKKLNKFNSTLIICNYCYIMNIKVINSNVLVCAYWLLLSWMCEAKHIFQSVEIFVIVVDFLRLLTRSIKQIRRVCFFSFILHSFSFSLSAIRTIREHRHLAAVRTEQMDKKQLMKKSDSFMSQSNVFFSVYVCCYAFIFSKFTLFMNPFNMGIEKKNCDFFHL